MRVFLLASILGCDPTTSFALTVGRSVLSMTGVPPSSASLHRYFILRHGETDANASGRIQGSADFSRLTERGQSQAARVGSVVFGGSDGEGSIDGPIRHVYASPLTRAQETLQIIREHADPSLIPGEGEIVLDELREIDLYDWEGRHTSEIEENDPEAYAAWTMGDAHGMEVSGCKPIVEMWARAGRVWEIIRSANAVAGRTDSDENPSSTLLVCHGTLGQGLLSSALGLDETHFRRHDFPNCGMAEIVWYHDEEIARNWRWHHPSRSELMQPFDQTVLA
uniref:Phosphoglycerate mutase n=1 Tax=Odontella aurita TaxID=265563 RepID=A0A7S4I552_9STRA|mmetsp:Transcript_20139/g.58231  ORF Transcript_20139/g.58231 Transcript_20139/m.58231 type:complete len:280 (+) Transcript_20139:179-1018(+)